MVSSTQVEDNAGKRAANNDEISSSDNENNHTSKKVKREGDSEDDNDGQTSSITDSNIDNDKPRKGKGGAKNKEPMSKAREIRLEQNRKAARESRRRKKVLQEELQRSVIFFSRGEFYCWRIFGLLLIQRLPFKLLPFWLDCLHHHHVHSAPIPSSSYPANGTLKQQNEELQRMLAQARTHVSAIESGQGGGGMLQQQQQPAGGDAKDTNQNQVQAGQTPQLNNNAVAAQAQGGGQMGMGQFNAQAGQGQQQQVQGNGNNQVFDPNNTGAQSAPAPAADSNNMMNWMNFQAAAMAGGVPGLASMGFDPNSPYAQALGQVSFMFSK